MGWIKGSLIFFLLEEFSLFKCYIAIPIQYIRCCMVAVVFLLFLNVMKSDKLWTLTLCRWRLYTMKQVLIRCKYHMLIIFKQKLYNNNIFLNDKPLLHPLNLLNKQKVKNWYKMKFKVKNWSDNTLIDWNIVKSQVLGDFFFCLNLN